MMYAVSTIETAKGTIVAACDADILGDVYTEDGVTLDVDAGFYGGEEVELQAVIDALDSFLTANLVGNRLVAALVEEDVVDADEVEDVDGVKHVQLFQV